MTIRPACRSDIPALGTLAERAGLFPADLLAGMIAPALDGGPEFWLVADPGDGPPRGLIFARPEEVTDATWNLLAIAVAPEDRRRGTARRLLAAAEARLSAARLIVIETTQLPEQDPARRFYTAAGYAQQARIPDFYEDGVDKIVFTKRVRRAP